MTDYRGWLIRAHEQVLIPPCLQFVAYAKREERGKVIMFNVEGRTLQGAVERVKMGINHERDLRH